MTAERAPSYPWYGFLYRLLGAHGTFWLWVLSVVAMWWTWQGALVRVLDREPEHRTVFEIAAANNGRRWVELYGVEVWLDGALLGREPGGTSGSPVAILIDANDPAARFWHVARLFADVNAAVSSPKLDLISVELGDASAAAALAHRRDEAPLAFRKLQDALLSLRKDVRSGLPSPTGAILLLRGGSRPDIELPGAAIDSSSVASPAVEPTPAAPWVGTHRDQDEIDPYVEAVISWGELVRRRVRVSFPTGLLAQAPRSLLERLEADLGAKVAQTALEVDRQPRQAELYVFCAAFLLMVFLAAGLYGRPSPKAPASP